MNIQAVIAGFILLVLLGVGAFLYLASTPQAPDQIRIGTYDNRAIAIAFASSAYNPAKGKQAELEQAKAAGDEAKVEELEAWGQTLQRKLHFQGFGHYPVDDLLVHVADKLPAVARQHHLDAIAWQCDHSDANVVIVDITDELAALFDPPERVLASIQQMRSHNPLPFETLVNLPPDD